MSKDSWYFPHDYYARLDPKLAKLRMERGLAGVGLFWCIVEKLYEADGYLQVSDLPIIAHELDVKLQTIEAIIGDHYQLLRVIDGQVTSDSVLKRLNFRKVKTEKARQSAFLRWGGDANAMRTQCERNAIKERKEKKRKDTTPTPSKGNDVVLPDWIKKEDWAAFKEMRLKLRAPLTDSAAKLIIYKLARFRADGDDAGEVLNQSIENGYRGVFPLRKGGGNGRTGANQQATRQFPKAGEYTMPPGQVSTESGG